MVEEVTRVDFASFPPEQREQIFTTLVKNIGITIGGDKEKALLAFGNDIVAYHQAGTEMEKAGLRERLDARYATLSLSSDQRIVEALEDIITAETSFL